VSVIIRSDGGQGGALAFISPEALEEMAGNGGAEHPERVNGTKVGHAGQPVRCAAAIQQSR
jgi:hypothetical protein